MSMDIMSHDQAVSSHAAERYVVGELSGSERESFEGHYFDCPDCFEQIRTDGRLMAEFLGHAREVLDPEPEKSWLAQMLGDLRRPAPVFVSALLLCALGIGVYQQSVITNARAPQVEQHYDLVAAKGAVQPLKVSRKARLGLNVVFSPGSEFTSYRAQIVNESGKVVRTVLLPESLSDSVTITLQAATLQAGRYSLVIQGITSSGAANEVGSAPFDLQFTD
jgi:anti-sigma factor RsiW